jgi:hypothetical protein
VAPEAHGVFVVFVRTVRRGSIWTAGGTGVPGIDVGQADALPPEEEDVRRPEHRDDSR